MDNCYTCELVAKRDAETAPAWEVVLRTEHWDLVHAYNSRLAGWLVLVSRRHLSALHEMNSAESQQLGPLIQQASAALQQVTGCIKTYIMQFAEHPEHPHVHFHIVPRMADQPDELKSIRVFGYMTDDLSERVSEEKMLRISAEIRQIMEQSIE